MRKKKKITEDLINAKKYNAVIKLETKTPVKNKQSKYACSFTLSAFKTESWEITYGLTVRFEKTAQAFNDLIILNAFDDILSETGKSFWKMDFLLDDLNRITEVVNLQEIRETWDEKRKYVEMTYQGDLVKDYLDIMENKLYNDEEFMQSLETDPIIVFFFNRKELSQKNKESGTVPTHNRIFRNYIGESCIWFREEGNVEILNGKYIISSKGNSYQYENIPDSLCRITGEKECDETEFSVHYTGKKVLEEDNTITNLMVNMEASYKNLFHKKLELQINID